jgi:rare lipoprotein A
MESDRAQDSPAGWRRWCVALVLPVLSSCGSMPSHGYYQEDGPPAVPVDVSQIPNAVPRVEPRSPYGNPPHYEVAGRRYQVLASSAGYVERGIASWYGSKFQGHRTSSGELYDMNAMTAAHPTLPIPTYVQVTNLRNGRKVIVKVNDRGPFLRNRLIDLSYVAAVKLGITAEGTGLVEVRAIDPAVPQTEAVASPAAMPAATRDDVDLYLQVGAFSDRDNARRLLKRLSAVTAGAAVHISEGAGGALHGPVYRVRIGPLPSVQEVDRLSRKLSDIGVADARVVID